MLFCYAAEAYNDNWLHEALLTILIDGIDRLDSGRQVAAWPDCIPEQRRAALSAKTGLRDRCATFFAAYDGLAIEGRTATKGAVSLQNAIPELYDGHTACVRLSDLPEAIHEPAKELFRFAFKLLTAVGLRDEHYKKVYENLKYRVCPFCGVERLDAPSTPREDLDHYLPISIYPFAGSNLRNLSPMGGRCNSSFKHTADVIFDTAGARRRCSDPYSGPSFRISLRGSEPFEGQVVKLIKCPRWVIEIEGDDADADAAATWDNVFSIRERYITSHLNPEFRDWVSHFAKWCVRSGTPLTDTAEAVAALSDYVEITIQEGLADSAFLKRAVFSMLRDRCASGNLSMRLTEWLIDLVSNHMVADAA
jgi:hypothetical protein